MEMVQSLWRGRLLNSSVDANNEKYIIMNGDKSLLYFPVQVLQNVVYRIRLELMKESGNGIVYCNIYGNKNFDFPQSKVECFGSQWNTFEMDIVTKSFPKTLPLVFRLWRSPDGTGRLAIKRIYIELFKGDVVEEAPKLIDVKEFFPPAIPASIPFPPLPPPSPPKPKETSKKEEKNDFKHRPSIESTSLFFNKVESNGNVNLFVPYYFEIREDRRKELDFCILENIKNSYINKVFLFSETKRIPDDFFNEKVVMHFIDKYITFNYIFKFINDNNIEGINMVSNTDMYFDSTVKEVKKICFDKDLFIALGVWTKKDNNEIYMKNIDSAQGAWIFGGKIREFEYNIPLGKPGCDNRLLYELKEKGYRLCNACNHIKVYHHHNTDIRNYSKHETIPGPYVMLKPLKE